MTRHNNKTILGLIFITALSLRLLFFKQSTYFGFDEARDAFVSQQIYKKHDLKLIGPPANAPGLNHGVLHWYIIGLVYLLGHGSVYFSSFFFRFVNALAIFPVYLIGKKYFNRDVGLISAVIFAFSFEQTQYAIYMGNPSLAVLSWISVFLGAGIILSDKNKFWGLPLIVLGFSTATQLDLFLLALIGPIITTLFILRKSVKNISSRSLFTSIIIGLSTLSSFIVAELLYHFKSLKSGLQLLAKSNNIIGSTDTKWSVYLERFLLLFQDNILWVPKLIATILVTILISLLLLKSRKDLGARVILVWIFSGLFILMLGAYKAYYINVGIGTGLIIGVSLLLSLILKKSRYLFILFLLPILISNLVKINRYNRNGLIPDIKTQAFMNLDDQLKILRIMYTNANGNAFTIRATTMPYKIPTVWAYLFKQYGQKEYNYLPYWETGNIQGYPGELPQPIKGSTCIRYLLREPTGGIPQNLVDFDNKEENLFSTVVKDWQIGHFYLQQRASIDFDCHNNKPYVN